MRDCSSIYWLVKAPLILNDPFINAISGSATSYLPDIYGVGLPTLVLLMYIGSLVLTHIRRQQSGLRTISLVQLVIQIVLTAIIVEGTVILFESYLGVPYAAAILIGLILIVWFMLTKTSFGRHIYAVGGNAEASRRAGINVTGIRIAVFTLCSTLAAIGGILAASHANSVASQISATLLLQAIAAAVIGGVSLFGGRGSVWSILLGALIIGSLENGLDLKSQGTEVKDMIEVACSRTRGHRRCSCEKGTDEEWALDIVFLENVVLTREKPTLHVSFFPGTQRAEMLRFLTRNVHEPRLHQTCQ